MNSKNQYGVIPYIKTKKSLKIFLITSRTNGYWILPKGHLVKKKSCIESAAQEAFEEAGIIGCIEGKKSYLIKYQHHGTKYKIQFFPMEVTEILKKWPEQHQRIRKLVSLNRAHELIELGSIQKCLRQWQDDLSRK
ncbi:NUDIX hydrolase [Desulfotalea psychrophila]|uniref:Nudix hydrolase domain-containing protein n=1 Tax=Desulfotalea psychrophila (strain LSv54 / DSM 12343) TaxID=177439 RepID=Q6ANU5_DESPS|nr:NUDIX hydrolase [Desulfotalea psychrophila]CAG35979.1 hypothetical protein DP1250 [Desulfotalea psychrophila LSv54]